ncbi:hypothetical protein AB6A40_000585 [Gnathostoma spinigerum]|uniref:Uncharacterized protein n=1 Tax=Gnathostoma spinigerum TaxID=75299 RepID=A0ABD6E4F5_9BILA
MIRLLHIFVFIVLFQTIHSQFYPYGGYPGYGSYGYYNPYGGYGYWYPGPIRRFVGGAVIGGLHGLFYG